MYVNLSNFVCDSACDANCATCKDTTTNCLTCSSGLYLDNITVTTSGVCLVCHPPCAVCQSPSQVELCVDCQYRYYLDNTQTCQSCHPTCYKCSGTADVQCTECAPGEFLVVAGTDQTCQSCTQPCFECSSASVCLSCIPQYFLSGTTCLPCTPPCFNCVTTTTTCVDCFLSDFRGVVNDVCVCLPHYYDQNNGDSICLICDTNCKTCVDVPTKCTSCEDGFYLDGTTCLDCDIQCKTCQTSATNCTSCNADIYLRTLYNNQCVCDDGLYYSDAQLICSACVSPCGNCLSGKDGNGINYDGNQCETCLPDNNRALDNTTQTCPCQIGFFDAGYLVCQACTSYCISCITNELDCDQCKPSTFRDPAKKCLCQDGYFGTDLVCQPCTFPCFQCEIQSDRCIACSPGRVLDGNTCDCAYGFYEESDGSCQSCQSPCASCVTLPTFCYSCVSGYYQPLGELQCLACIVPCENCNPNDGQICTTCLPNYNREVTNSVCVCMASYYQMDDVTPCIPCDSTCYNCENNGDGTQCTECRAGDNRTLDTSKQCVCNLNHFSQSSSSVCLPCIAPCLSCIISQASPPADGTQFTILAKRDKTEQLILLTIIVLVILVITKLLESYCVVCVYLLVQNALIMELEMSVQYTHKFIVYTSCVAGSNRVAVSQVCVCGDGYYQVGTNVTCSQCYYTCQKCQNLPTECHQCDPLKHRVLSSTTCICQDNYYDNLTNDQDCKPCISECFDLFIQALVNNVTLMQMELNAKHAWLV